MAKAGQKGSTARKVAGKPSVLTPPTVFDLKLDIESNGFTLETANGILGHIWEELPNDSDIEHLVGALDALLQKAIAENRALHDAAKRLAERGAA